MDYYLASLGFSLTAHPNPSGCFPCGLLVELLRCNVRSDRPCAFPPMRARGVECPRADFSRTRHRVGTGRGASFCVSSRQRPPRLVRQARHGPARHGTKCIAALRWSCRNFLSPFPAAAVRARRWALDLPLPLLDSRPSVVSFSNFPLALR